MANRATPTIIIVGVSRALVRAVFSKSHLIHSMLFKLLTIAHRILLLHWLESMIIIIIVNIHLFHLLHHCTAVQGLEAWSASSFLWRLVDE